jgi:hypothetical protein
LKGIRVGFKWACRHDPLPKGENINNVDAYPQESKFTMQSKMADLSPQWMDMLHFEEKRFLVGI